MRPSLTSAALSGCSTTSPNGAARISWLFTLGALKAAGALGLLVGIGVPLTGVAAATGLVLFFVGAIAVVIRAGWYSHLAWPSTYLLLAVGSLALRLVVL